jgi:hypothetical protein
VLLGVDVNAILRDGNLLGGMLDTLVAAQLRPEAALSTGALRLYHARVEGGRHEVDLLGEIGGGRVIGIELKAGATPTRTDGRHLEWLRDQLGDRFVAGVVLHTGPRAFLLSDRIVAAPIAALWS